MKNRKIYLPFTDTFDPFRDSAESEGYRLQASVLKEYTFDKRLPE